MGTPEVSRNIYQVYAPAVFNFLSERGVLAVDACTKKCDYTVYFILNSQVVSLSLQSITVVQQWTA